MARILASLFALALTFCAFLVNAGTLLFMLYITCSLADFQNFDVSAFGFASDW